MCMSAKSYLPLLFCLVIFCSCLCLIEFAPSSSAYNGNEKTAVIAKYAIPSGAKFSAKYLETVKLRYAPVDYVNSIPLIKGQYCRFNLSKGELIAQHHVSQTPPRLYPPMPNLSSILAYRKNQLDQANQEQMVTVIYSGKNLPAGSALTSSHLLKRNMKVGEVPRDAVSSIGQAKGKRARGFLAGGQVLSYRDLTTLEEINRRRK